MADDTPSQRCLRETQYCDSRNLCARIDLHRRFSTNKHGWWRWVFDHFDLPKEARVLELGCGTGGLWVVNQERIPDSWDITLSDFSKGMVLDAARDLAALERPFSYLVAEAEAIPLGDESFDCVVANHVLFFVSHIDAAIAEIHRVLRPAGRLFASTNGRGHLREIRMLARETGLYPGPAAAPVDLRFGLENGGAILGTHFGDVQLHRYDDALFITEAEPLVAHVASVQPNKGARATVLRLAEFRAFINDYLRRHGHISVAKDSGMFEARR